LLHLLALLAMMLAPMAMHGAPAAAAAPAHHNAAEAPHCADSREGQDERERGRSADCAVACSAMTGGTQLSEPAPPPRAAFLAALTSFVAGTAPGSDPPPPRFA
jgi:hypothetical protein